MRILIIGGNGTIGKAITSHFSETHGVLVAGRTKGDVTVDISKATSIKEMFVQAGTFDGIICAAGEAKWDLFENLSEEDYYFGFQNKLMGQVNLVRIGLDYLRPEGFITLTTGILADHPVIKTASAAMVNGAIHSFVKAVALELKEGKRINVVSAGLVEDAYEKYKDYFIGQKPVPMNKVVSGYAESVQQHNNGEIIRIYN